MMKKGKLGNYIIIGLLICGFIQVAAVKVSASNWQDTSFDFCFSADGNWETTMVRTKEDNTSVYMNCESSDNYNNSYDAYVWGYDCDLDEYFCCSDVYTFVAGDVKKMINYVYENGGEYTYIKAELTANNGFNTGMFSGLWSPDSI